MDTDNGGLMAVATAAAAALGGSMGKAPAKDSGKPWAAAVAAAAAAWTVAERSCAKATRGYLRTHSRNNASSDSHLTQETVVSPYF